MFHNYGKKEGSHASKRLKDLTKIIPPVTFLSEAKRKELIQQIETFCALSSTRFNSLATPILNNLVDYYQHLPETTTSYYSQPGGLIEHALYRTVAALELFQQLVVKTGEEFSEEQKLWQYTLLSASFLRGIGKLQADYKIDLYNAQGQLLKNWIPVLESLAKSSYYSYELKNESDIEFRRRLHLLIAPQLMPAEGFTWISSNSPILAIWLALLNEDIQGAGVLGAILERADAIAIQKYLYGLIIKTPGTRKHFGPFAGVPESIIDKEHQLGAEFLKWLANKIATKQITINQPPLVMVPGGFVMSADLFKLFIRENSDYKNWQGVLKAVESLGLQFDKDRAVLTQYGVALPDTLQFYNKETDELISISAEEFIYNMYHAHSMPVLTASGWEAVNTAKELINRPGVIRG